MKRLRITLPLLVTVILIAALTASLRRPEGYRPQAGDDRPPTDPRYVRALQTGLRREYVQAEAEMVALAAAERHSSIAAWSLYQAALAARARGDRTAETAHRRALLSGYAAHPMALRVDNANAATPPARPGTDCGPRVMLAVCQEAGRPATLA